MGTTKLIETPASPPWVIPIHIRPSSVASAARIRALPPGERHIKRGDDVRWRLVERRHEGLRLRFPECYSNPASVAPRR
jgi:hypothetical protein